MALSLTQTALVRIVAGQAITNNLLRLLALSPSVSISGSVATADLAAGAVTPAKTSPGAYFYGALSGTNAYTLTLNPTLSAYADGVEVLGKVGNSNTAAATATLNVDSLGVKNIYHRSGVAPKAGDLVANDIIRFRYNSSRNTAAGGWDIMEVLPSATIRPAANDTAGSATVQTVVNSPPLTAYVSGVLLLVKVGASLTNTGALTLNCDGLGARSVLRPGGASLLAGDWVAGQTYLVYDDGTQYILLTKDAKPVVVVAACRNLVIQSTSATQATVTADEVVLKDSTGVPLLAAAVSVTLDITTAVALNGFETGASRGVSTWYYVWLISDGTNVRGVLESAGSGDGAVPGGPDLSNGAFTGYNYQALVGQIRLDATGSGEIVQFWQRDRDVFISSTNVFTAATLATSWTVLSGAELTALRAATPPTAVKARGNFGTTTTVTGDYALAIAACSSSGTADTTNILGLCVGTADPQGSTAILSFAGACNFEVPIRGGASRNLQTLATANTDSSRLNITGYSF